MPERPAYALRSVDNALRLLLLLRHRGQLRVAEAAAELDIAPSTAHRLLAMLVYRGFASKDRHHLYRVGPELAAVPSGLDDVAALCSVARPHLEALTAQTDETTHLVVREGSGVRFVDGVVSPHVLRVGSRVGMLLPAHESSGGKALLAELPAQELVALYPRGLRRSRTAAATDLAALRRELATIRRRGFAVNLEETEQGVNAIGTCVHDRTGQAVAAVVLAAPAARCDRRALVALAGPLLETARATMADL